MCAALAYGIITHKMKQEYQEALERIKQLSENLDELHESQEAPPEDQEDETEDTQESQPTFTTYSVDIMIHIDNRSGMANIRVGGLKVEDGKGKKITLAELKYAVQSAMEALDSDDAHDQWIRGIMGG